MVVKGITTPSGGVQSPEFFCIQSTGNDDPAPWPYRYLIRARFLDDVPIVVRDMLRSTLKDWLDCQQSHEIRVELVETGFSDVRFGLTASGVTVCALGKNVPTSQEQPTVLLGLRAWNKDESEVVWTHWEMERMARHVWGHVLGLPHASSSKHYEWKDAALDGVCSAMGVNKSQITQLRGNSKLSAWNSIMNYDRPSELFATPNSYRECNGNIDSNTVQLLNELYPNPREFELLHLWCSEMPDWKETWTEQKKLRKVHSSKWSSSWEICALNYIDLGQNGDYQASVDVVSTDDANTRALRMGGYSATSHIVNLRADFLLWKYTDWNIQTGTLRTGTIRGTVWTKVGGEQFEKRIDFGRPFKSVPKVVTFINELCVEHGNWLRLTVFPKDISNTGFTLCLHSWADTLCHNLSAYWLAHEADDVSIRSGRWEPPVHPGPWATEDRATIDYYSPLIARPREMFCGFDHVNVRGGVNARFRCEALSWNERSVEMKISTWQQENAYHSMGASYIALL